MVRVRVRLEVAERSDQFVAGARAGIEIGTFLGYLRGQGLLRLLLFLL